MYRILVVDDSSTDRTLLRGILAKNPYFEVHCAPCGSEALAQMAEQPADLVLTDIQMPEMDGLELVGELKRSHPHVPVVLVTGQGSEAIAAKALRLGAAGYVPKQQSAELLGVTVAHLLELARAGAPEDRLLEQATRAHLEFELRNDLALIPALQRRVRELTEAIGTCDRQGSLQVGVALEHALTNAMLHGNLELSQPEIVKLRQRKVNLVDFAAARDKQPPYCNRRVQVTVEVRPEGAQFVVADAGQGFDVSSVNSVGLTQALAHGDGRGLTLMWALMDKVAIDRTGTRVTLVKKRSQPAPEQGAAPRGHAAHRVAGPRHHRVSQAVPAGAAGDGDTVNFHAGDTHAGDTHADNPHADNPHAGDTGGSTRPPRPPYDVAAEPQAQAVAEVPAGQVPLRYGELVSLADGRRIPLKPERMTVGRQGSCDLVLHHSKVSAHHCILFVHEGWWFVKDLHSTNGTKVNHHPVTTHLVRPGATLTVGSLEFELDYRPHEMGAQGITPPTNPV